MFKNYTIHNDKDDSFYIINEDTGEQLSFESDYHVLEYSTNNTGEEKGEPASLYVAVSNVEFFDEEGMKVNDVLKKTKLFKWVIEVMEVYFQDDADQEIEDA